MPEFRFVENGDITLATQAFGRAEHPPVVLVMGAASTMLRWPDAFCEALALAGRYVVRFDHRDTGQSSYCPPGQPDYSTEDMAGDLRAVMDAYGIARAHLVGMSLGGIIAQILTISDPARVESLTLIATTHCGTPRAEMPGIDPIFLQHFSHLSRLVWSDRYAVAEFLLNSERLLTGPGRHFDATAARVRISRDLERTESPASAFNHALIGNAEIYPVRPLPVPPLLIHGAADSVLPVTHAMFLRTENPGSRLVMLSGAGHELNMEDLPRIGSEILIHTSP